MVIIYFFLLVTPKIIGPLQTGSAIIKP